MAQQPIIPEQELTEEDIIAQQQLEDITLAPERAPAQQPVMMPTQVPVGQGIPIVQPQTEASTQDPTGGASLGTKPMDIAINAYQDISGGLQQESEVLAETQVQEAKLAAEGVKAKGEINQAYQEKLAEIGKRKSKVNEEYFELITKAPKEIDPGRWWSNLSTGRKITMGIAQIMAGLGGNRVDPIGDAIKTDIQAQKDSYTKGVQKGKGLYEYYKNKGKTDSEAARLAYSTALNQIDEKMKSELLKTKAPQTRSRLMRAIGKNKVELGKFLRDHQAEGLDRAAKAGKDKGLKLGSEQQQKYAHALDAIDSIRKMRNELASGAVTFSVVGDTVYTSALKTFSQAFGRLMSGAAIKDEEMQQFRDMTPRKTDSKKVQQFKLNWMEKQLQRRADIITKTSGAGDYKIPGTKKKKYRFKKSK